MAKTPAKAANKASKLSAPVSCNIDREHQSVSVRKIANGFLICKSMDGPKGYTSTETFSPTKPRIEMQVTPAKKR